MLGKLSVSVGELLAEYGRLPHLLGCHGNLNLEYCGREASAGTVVLARLRLEQAPPLPVLVDLQLLEM